ncbi:subclass B3 metallo-beta-lactamase [Novosphingobium colocasiae]|nr:subclass B3 metallo-beta-lactamase [Novosphingobium colocasiae]
MIRSFAALSPGLLAASAFLSLPAAAKTPAPEPRALAASCAGRDGWADPAPPAHIYGNTWYVGTCGITVLLVTSANGHVLVDGGPEEAAPLVLANIRKLGFDPRDVRWIVASHEHHDHVGSLAALKVATGAKVAALGSTAAALEAGEPTLDDPQRGLIARAPSVAVDKVLADGDSVTLTGTGLPLVLTAHATPAHSPGSTSWTWQSCDPALTCRMIAYADSISTPAADGYRFSAHPDRVARFALGADAIAALPCDILLTPHPAASAMFERFAAGGALVDAAACARYAEAGRTRFAARLAEEAGKNKP